MKKTEMKTSVIQTRIEPSIHARLNERAIEEDRSVASLIRKAILEYLNAANAKN